MDVTYKKVVRIRKEYKTGKTTIRELAEKHDLQRCTINKIVNGESPYDIVAVTEHFYERHSQARDAIAKEKKTAIL